MGRDPTSDKRSRPGATIELDDILEERSMGVAERMAQLPQQWLREGADRGWREGVDQGRREGVTLGVAQESALLRRQAALRFGPEVGERVGGLLRGIDDWELLAAVGELVVTARNGPALLDSTAELLRLSG